MLSGGTHVLLDISHKPAKEVLHHFPNIARKVLKTDLSYLQAIPSHTCTSNRQ
jgi:aspartate oxidase